MNADHLEKEVGRAYKLFFAALDDHLAACDDRPPSICYPAAISRVESVMAMALSAENSPEGSTTEEHDGKAYMDCTAEELTPVATIY